MFFVDESPKRPVGRPRGRTGKTSDPEHRERPDLDAKHPVHITMRAKRRDLRMRCRPIYTALRKVVARYLGRDDFRIVHLSIQSNHLHLLVEASHKLALSRGMQSFTINAARAINAARGTQGKVFAYRYHARQLVTGYHARRAITYVLNNWRKHDEDTRCPRSRRAMLDPYASGYSFPGWEVKPPPAEGFTPLPVSPPRTLMLRAEWRAYGGLIDPRTIPGPWQGAIRPPRPLPAG